MLVRYVVWVPESYEELFQRAAAHYASIKALSVPALGGDLVFFTRLGFNHLLRKGRYPRFIKDRVRRLRLLKYVEEILQHSTSTVSFHTARTSRGRNIKYWAFSRQCGGRIVTVVISQIEGGPKTFLSVMD